MMKLFKDLEDAKAKRKSLKPQVERRRRERMNHSLDSLKTLLLQRQDETSRRVEKAEILEHTVLFLQNTAKGERTRAEDGGGGHKHSYQDGFSSCLQKAAQFLGPDGKGLWSGAALDASFAARFSCSVSDAAAGVQSEDHSPSKSLHLRKSSRSILRSLIDRSGYRICTPSLKGSSCVRLSEESLRTPQTHQQPHKLSSRGSKRSPPQSQSIIHSLWRPWP
ncbi:transcription factor HES-5-like [Notolabrus celidotus]|uniref:transcription factor HES-5-like n=1 Tax=Notolabrus celidotus TaxID=1203425 RepID=UPI00148F7465|nr:transcription factor HES-5-like [Notolabrus celidotus]